ncbi:syntaxin-binding protein 5-like isoform X6 [Tachypleus tridentatus]|uniref:syntaxin-binding protein 5-like isoform X6 n=1 Tax=Tachypleus tridentatus TaxID=6853 RepID=UPI003FD2775F
MPRTEMKRTGGFFKGMLDGLRSSVSQPVKSETEIEESLQTEHFQAVKTVRHGFPFQPTALAFDPIQRLLAIGTRSGSLRILGRPGVDCYVQHVLDTAVIQLLFLVNEGALISVCSDDSLHLWNLRQKRPEIVHSLKFQKERITCCHLPFQSNWLYIGTERGNIHVVNVESFILSGYVINWNKAIELSRKTHPGCVIHLSDNPVDANKLLVGYETGAVVLWDLRNRAAEMRLQNTEPLKSVSWHHDGKQFMCSHTDGSISTWNLRTPLKPTTIMHPHAQATSKEGKAEPCKTVYKVEWKTVRGGDSFVIFSGGLPHEKTGKTLSLTVIHGKTTTVLEMEHTIVDFVTLCETPWQSDFQEPYAIVVLLNNDLVVVDLTSQGYPCFQNPYPMDLHESPVTFCSYFAECPADLIPAFYSVGSKGSKRSGFSEKEWPICGGEWGTGTVSYPEIIITGHADGSIKFWDASAVALQVLYKLKTSKVFERPKPKSLDGQEDDPFAVEQIYLCVESRVLCMAGASSHVIMFKFNKQESTSEVTILEIPIIYDVDDDPECSPEADCSPRPTLGVAFQQGSYSSASEDSAKKQPTTEYYVPLKVKSGPQKRAAGFQPDLVCLTPWVDGEPPGHITALSVNSSYGLMAYGNECGLVVVDIIQRTCLLNMGTPDLYGSSDPYQRVPRSPKRNPIVSTNDNGSLEQDRCRSPTSDQINGVCLSPTTGKQQMVQRRPMGPEMRRTKSQDKIDNSFSRSRSSSMSSLENISAEAIQWLSFAETFFKKSDSATGRSLWVGTSLGSVIVVLLTLPANGDIRLTQPVIVSPSGTIYRMKGSVLSVAFLDSSGALIPYLSESWRDISRNNNKEKDDKKMKAPMNNSSKNRASPTSSSSEVKDSQFVVMASEKQARVVALPSQTCVYKTNLTDTSFVVRAEVIPMKSLDNACLACYIGNGNIVVYSLPSLRLLYEVDFLPLMDMRIAKTFCFSNNGHGLYLCSASEFQKFSISAAFCEVLQDMLGTLFLTKDMPEPPKQGFFKGLFGGGPSVLDREELFGEASGKASKSVARHIPGNSNLEHVKGQAGSLAGELARARQGLTERGEALGLLEERTAKMMSEAEMFSNTTHNLLLRYKDKKWYQF